MTENQRSDRILGLLALSVLGGGCLWVLWPFMSAVLWAVILSSVTWPAFIWLDRLVGGRRMLSASLMTLVVTLTVVVPFVGVATGLADNLTELGQMISGLLKDGLPDAPGWIASLPLIGQLIALFAQGLTAAVQALMPGLTQLITALTTALAPIMPILAQFLTELGTALGQVLTAALQVVVPLIGPLVQLMLPWAIVELPERASDGSAAAVSSSSR